MLRETFRNYILAPLVFIIVYGGMLVALIRDRMREEDRIRKFGF